VWSALGLLTRAPSPSPLPRARPDARAAQDATACGGARLTTPSALILPFEYTKLTFDISHPTAVEVARHLKQHFEFLVCEPSLSTELCDAKKGCVVCHKFAAK
jgi:hypothetical protein